MDIKKMQSAAIALRDNNCEENYIEHINQSCPVNVLELIAQREALMLQAEEFRRKYQREHIETNRWKNRAELAEARIEQANKQEPEAQQEFSDDEYICIRDAVDRLMDAVDKEVDGDQSECSLVAEFIDEIIRDVIKPLNVEWVEEDDWCGYRHSVPEPKQEPVVDRYCGHSSLADMVSAHTHVWRTLLEDEHARNNCERPYINHELNALSDIEVAIKFELEHPFNLAPTQAAAIPESWRLTKAGQIKVGDVISMVMAGRRICTSAKEVLNAGTDREEVIYNRKKNHYFITSMVLNGTSNHKEVFIIPGDSLSAAPKPEGEQ